MKILANTTKYISFILYIFITKLNMMKNLYIIILAFIAFIPFNTLAQGKIIASKDKDVISIEAGRKTAAPYSVLFKNDAAYKPADAQQLFSKYLSARPGTDELRAGMINILQGITLTRYQQYFKGIKVEHGSYTIAAAGEKVSYMMGDFFTIDAAQTITPSLSVSDAWKKAWLYTDGVVPADPIPATGELVFIENGIGIAEPDGKAKLAYKFFIDSRSKALTHNFVYVDAKDGTVLFTDNQIKAGCYKDHKGADAPANDLLPKPEQQANAPDVVAPSAASIYSGTLTNMVTRFTGGSYRLEALLASELYPNHTRNINHALVEGFTTVAEFTTAMAASTEITDADNNWTAAEFNNANRDNTAFDVHWGAQRVYDYWKARHSRNSWDNANGVLNCYVHADVNWDNAFWQGGGGINSMFYGDGSNLAGGFSTLSALDVTGHEIGHGVCQATSNLTYSNQSGAMNEGFSDIWGASIEHLYDPHEIDATAKSYFDIGEEIKIGGGALRSMSNPKLYGQPDTYLGTNWYAGAADNGGVHTNSGVLNYWFYLIVSGKAAGTNDAGNAYSVPAIGWVDAEHIVFQGEVALTASATYAACRTAMINAATSLFGACSLQTEAVTRAWYAVGVGADFVPCVPSISFNGVAQSVSETGTTGATCLKTSTVTIPLKISAAASQAATVSFTLSGTAVSGSNMDYTISPATVTFPAGSTAAQNVTLTINNDAYAESDETAILTINTVSTAGNAVKGNVLQQYTVTILNDDYNPSLATLQTSQTLYSENFTAPAGFTLATSSGAVNIWRLGRNTGTDTYFGASNNCAYISQNTTSFTYSTTAPSLARLQTPAISTLNSTNLQLTYDYICNGEITSGTIYDYGTLWYSLDGGSNWLQVNGTQYQGITSKVTITVPLPAAANNAASLMLGFRWDNDNSDGSQPPFGIDNIVLRGDKRAPAAVQTAVNTGGSSDQEYLGPNGTVNFYDKVSGNVMGTIQNLSAHDYGCTTFEVDRAGTSAQFITGDVSGNNKQRLADKTFKVTPTTNNAAGNYRITLYYTAAEKAGYETSSTRAWVADNGSNNGIRILKTPTNISSLNIGSASVANSVVESTGTFGTGYTVTASFTTGFSGFGVGIPPAVVVPVSLISFEGVKKGSSTALTWNVSEQINVRSYIVEFAANGSDFASAGNVAANGLRNSAYNFLHTQTVKGDNYYRLKIVSSDGTFRYSNVVKIRFDEKEWLTVTPNPVTDNFTIKYNSTHAIRSISVIDVNGKVMRLINPAAGTGSVIVNASAYPAGVYLIRVLSADNSVVTQKIIKQ